MSSLSLHLSIRIRSVKEILHAVDAVSLQVSLRLLFMTVLNQEMRVSSQARRKRGNMKKGNGKDVWEYVRQKMQNANAVSAAAVFSFGEQIEGGEHLIFYSWTWCYLLAYGDRCEDSCGRGGLCCSVLFKWQGESRLSCIWFPLSSG